MPHQIANKAAVPLHTLGTSPIGDSRGLHDRDIVAHVVDDTNEPAIEDVERLAKDRF